MATPAAGCAGAPLWRKLGIAAGRRLDVRMAPPAFDERIAAPASVPSHACLADIDLAFPLVTARA